ncbi:hypothetical protein V1520DRAFT_47029 [Lipomyces starkeyi]|uniref:Uncharacterized protein n=1 Tax=Lipomyces starkeyi NRRL Y-11557 TaxID=675824 RepID=A0A1E3PYX3_LIPST|nr:hypothetical protein LIPSTDRAFT_155201 [Lipomyces starkeyi NRRL Y-11557]
MFKTFKRCKITSFCSIVNEKSVIYRTARSPTNSYGQDLLLLLYYHFLPLVSLVSRASIISKSCILTVIKQSYWFIVVSQNKSSRFSISEYTTAPV